MKNDFEFLSDGTIKIFLTQSQYTIIDIADFEKVAPYRWGAAKSPRSSKLSFYAKTKVRISGKVEQFSMHSLINQTSKGFLTDHENGDTLDNRRCNLRTASYAENQRNGEKYRNNKSGYKGVYWVARHNKFMVSIKINGKNKTVGYFDDKLNAAHAYNAAAVQYHGKFARLNLLQPVR